MLILCKFADKKIKSSSVDSNCSSEAASDETCDDRTNQLLTFKLTKYPIHLFRLNFIMKVKKSRMLKWFTRRQQEVEKGASMRR